MLVPHCCITISGRIYQNTQGPFLPTCSTSPPSVRSGVRADMTGSVHVDEHFQFMWQQEPGMAVVELIHLMYRCGQRNASGRATWKRRVFINGNQWESLRNGNSTPCSHVLCNPMEGRAPSTSLKSSGVKRAGLPTFPPLLALLLSNGWVSGPGILPPCSVHIKTLQGSASSPRASDGPLSPRRGFTCHLRSGVDRVLGLCL